MFIKLSTIDTIDSAKNIVFEKYSEVNKMTIEIDSFKGISFTVYPNEKVDLDIIYNIIKMSQYNIEDILTIHKVLINFGTSAKILDDFWKEKEIFSDTSKKIFFQYMTSYYYYDMINFNNIIEEDEDYVKDILQELNSESLSMLKFKNFKIGKFQSTLEDILIKSNISLFEYLNKSCIEVDIFLNSLTKNLDFILKNKCNSFLVYKIIKENRLENNEIIEEMNLLENIVASCNEIEQHLFLNRDLDSLSDLLDIRDFNLDEEGFNIVKEYIKNDDYNINTFLSILSNMDIDSISSDIIVLYLLKRIYLLKRYSSITSASDIYIPLINREKIINKIIYCIERYNTNKAVSYLLITGKSNISKKIYEKLITNNEIVNYKNIKKDYIVECMDRKL